MVKRKIQMNRMYLATLFTLFILLSTFAIGAGKVQIIIDSKIPTVYEKIDLSAELMNSFSTDIPDNILRVVHIIDLKKETYSRKVNEFVRDKEGTYVYYNGTYYYTSKRARYSYDSKNDKYVLNASGSYIYVPEFSWARSDEEKYVASDLYKRYEKIVNGITYYMSLYITDVDIENVFVKSVIPVNVSDDSVRGLISKATRQHYEIVNRKSPYKIDIAIVFNPSIDKNMRMSIISKLQEDTRYNIYDRLYLDEVFKTIKFKDLFGKEANLKFTPPAYIIAFDNPVSTSETTQSTKYLFFENAMNGSYIKKSLASGANVPVRIQVGRYYSYDSDKKTYVLNMKDGRYVRYPENGWEKESYVSESTFYDYILFEETDMEKYTSLLCNIYDTETGEILGSKVLESLCKIPKKEITDRFGTERVNSETEANMAIIQDISSDVYEFLQLVFPLSSVVSKVQGNRVSLLSGENVGMKKGYVFQDIYDGFTMGYLRIDKVAADTSEGSAFYIIPGEQIKENSYAIESKRYPNFIGGRFTFSVSNEGLNFTLGYVSSDIYNNHKQSFSIGYSITDLSAATPTNQFFAESSFFVLSKQLEIYFDLGMQSSDNFETVNAFVSPGVRISSYTDNSIYYPGGFGIFAQLEGKIAYSNATFNITPILSLGMETRF